MGNLKISIITIVYNDVKHIEKTIESIISQEYNNTEYIIVDGGSTDGTCKKIEKIVPKIKNACISYSYISEQDKGISDAFNKGIRKSTGDIIGLINSGDCLMPGALKFLNSNWNTYDEIVYGKTLAVDEKYGLKYLREIPDKINLDRMKYNGMIFTHQSSFVRRDIYLKYGMYDLNYKYVMDWDLFMHFYYNKHVRFRYIDYIFVSMLCGGISARISEKMVDEQIRISKKYGGYTSIKIWINYYKEIPKGLLKNILRRYPTLWYRLIGSKRVYKNSKH